MSLSITEEKRKEKRIVLIPFLRHGDSQKEECVFWKVYAWLGLSVKVWDLVFSPSRSNLGLVSSRLAGFVRNREIYNLGMVSGPVLLKIKGQSWIFIFSGSKEQKTIERK